MGNREHKGKEDPHTMQDHPLSTAHIRIARPTTDLLAVRHFYHDLLGFHVQSSFVNHEDFSGVMLGLSGCGYHLEFTVHHPADDDSSNTRVDHGRAPSQDHLIVFYLPSRTAYDDMLRRMHDAGIAPVKSFNPYWDEHGTTFEDPDGYRVVFVHGSWTPSQQ